MVIKVAKQFRWEGAHRLPWHDGGCSSLHGHSYRMVVELEGEPDERGMLIDFKDMKRVLKPLVEAWYHATLVAEYDTDLQHALQQLGSKYFILPFDSTSENLCAFVADYLEREGQEALRQHCITKVCVTVQETETCYAQLERPLEQYKQATDTGSSEQILSAPMYRDHESPRV